MVALEVSRQMKMVAPGVPASMSTDAPQSVAPSSDPVGSYSPMAVEASNLVPFGDIRSNGAPSAELRAYAARMLSSLDQYGRSLFENATQDVVMVEPRYQMHSKMLLCTKKELA